MITFARLFIAALMIVGVQPLASAATADAAAGDTAAAPPAFSCAIDSPAPEFAGQVSYSAGHARVWRLYQAFFLRQPDQTGFDYWVGIRTGGLSLSALAFQFATSAEFIDRYGNLTNAQYVDLVYGNVLCRAPDPDGRAYWTGLLETGALTRWDMMVNFSELKEYLRLTGTCHSVYPAESADVAACAEANLVPLAGASLSVDGYQAKDVNYAGGSFRGVEADLTRPLFETGTDRCSVASINGNWLVASEKDRPNPGVLGVGIVDGRPAKGSSDRADRGVFGLRFDPTPSSVVEVWPGDTLSPDDVRLNSVAYHHNRTVIESWHAAAETSPYLTSLAPAEIVNPSEWAWAAAGIPLIVDGQTDLDFSADYANDPYTYQTTRHSFVAIDQDTSRIVFGGTSNLDVRDLVNWANGAGYEDLIKFDGGGSAEFNIGGSAVVAGTSRDVPVWLGIGC
jgi:hypothetical protein